MGLISLSYLEDCTSAKVNFPFFFFLPNREAIDFNDGAFFIFWTSTLSRPVFVCLLGSGNDAAPALSMPLSKLIAFFKDLNFPFVADLKPPKSDVLEVLISLDLSKLLKNRIKQESVNSYSIRCCVQRNRSSLKTRSR